MISKNGVVVPFYIFILFFYIIEPLVLAALNLHVMV